MFRKIRLLSRRFKKSAAIPPAILQTDSIDTNYHLEQQQKQQHEATIRTTTNGVYEEKKYDNANDANDDEKTDISPLGCESVKQIINFNPYPFIPPIEISIPVKITCHVPEEEEDDDHQIIQLDDSKSSSKIRRFQFLLRRQQSCGSRIECQDTIDVFTGIRSTSIHYIKRPTSSSNNNNEGVVVDEEEEKEEEERVSYYTGPTDMLSDGSSRNNNNTNNRTRRRLRRKGILRSEMKNMFLLRRSTSNTNTKANSSSPTAAKTIQQTNNSSSGNVELNSAGFLA